MADLPTNVSYSGGNQIDPAKAYSAARAAIMARYSAKKETPQQGWTGPAPKAYWGEGDQPIAGIPYAKAQIDPNKPQWSPQQVYTNNQTGQQINSYLPPDYQTAPGLPGKYESPSAPENLRLRNLPENLGAGQYVVDTEKPGSVILSKRGVRPDQFSGSPTEYASPTVGQLNKNILGGTTSARGTSGGGFQIDHIVPLWLGGADTPENKQLLSPTTHEKKTKVQSVALTLLQSGKITTDQAKMMALRWQDKDDSGITTFNNGYVDLNEAEKVSKQWQEDDSKVKYKWTDVFKELKNIKDFGQETLGSSAPAAFFRELAKGAASGSTLEYIPYEMDDDYKSGLAKASAMAGGTIGNIAGFLTLGRIAGGVGAVGHLFGLMNKGSKWLGTMNKASKLGLGSSVVKEISKVPGVGQAVQKGLNIGGGISSSAKMMKALKEIDLFTTYGQLSRNGFLGQTLTGEENDWKERAVTDILTGGLMGGFSNAKQAAKQAGYVTSGAILLDAMMNVDNPDWTIESSLQHGLTIGGIHYLGLKAHGMKGSDKFTVGGIKNLGLKDRGLSSESINRQILEEQLDPGLRTGIFASAKHDKDLYKRLKKETGLNVKALDEQIAKAEEDMAKLFDDLYGKESMDRDFVTENNLHVIKMWQARQAFIRTLPEEMQHEARVADIVSLASYVKKNPPIQTKLNSAFIDSGTQVSKPRQIMTDTNYSNDQAAADQLASQGIVRIPTSGGATKSIQQNIANAKAAEAKGLLSPDVLIVSRSEQGPQIKVSSGKDYANPRKIQEVYAVETADKNGSMPYKYHLIGTIPETSMLEGYNKGRNAKFTAFDASQGNKDAMADFMVDANGNPLAVIKGQLEWASPSTENKVGSAVIHVNKTTAIEDARLLNEKWNTRAKELEINSDLNTVAEKTLSDAGMQVQWMNYHAAEISAALKSKDPQRLVDVIAANWGKNALSLEGAQKILLDPKAFTIGDMFALLKKTSEWGKKSHILDGMIRPPRGAASAWKEYKNTNLKTAEMPAEIKAALPKTIEPKPVNPVPPVAPKPGEAVTLIGDSGEMIAPKKYSAAAVNVRQARQKVAPQKRASDELAQSIKNATKAVKESPLAREPKVVTRASELPQIMQKERTRPLSRLSQANAPTGQNTPVLRTPQAASEKAMENGRLTKAHSAYKDRYLSEAEMDKGVKKKGAINGSDAKISDINEAEIEAFFDDAVETRIYTLAEKHAKTPTEVYRTIRGALANTKINPPEGASTEFKKQFYKTQQQIRNRVAAKYSQGIKEPELTDVKDGAEGTFSGKVGLTKEQIIEGGKQTPEFFRALAEKAKKKIKNGEKLGTWDGFGLFMDEVIPKIVDPKYSDSTLGYAFIKKMASASEDSFGRSKSQTPDYINAVIAHQRKTGTPPPKGFGKKIFEKVQKEREADKEASKMSEDKQDTGGTFERKSDGPDEVVRPGDGDKVEGGSVGKSDLKGMIIKGARQKDEVYDWMTEAEFNMPEIAANFRKGTDNPIDGLSAGHKLATQIIKNKIDFFKKNGWEIREKFPNLNVLQLEIMKKYGIKPQGSYASVKESAEMEKNAADAAQTLKIREWQNLKRLRELPESEKQKLRESLSETLKNIKQNKSNK